MTAMRTTNASVSLPAIPESWAGDATPEGQFRTLKINYGSTDI